MTKLELARLCRKAAGEIQRNGLCKGDYGYPEGPKCAVGALRYAQSGDTGTLLRGVNLKVLFRAARPRARVYTNPIDFSDAERTRKHDVVRLLRDMAAAAGKVQLDAE